MTTLTKAEVSDILFENLGLNKRESKDMVEAFFIEIADTLSAGQWVKLSGFGNFQLRDKPQRPGRNPKTGEEIPITARRVVTFHPSQKLKDEVERGGVHDLTPYSQAALRRAARRAEPDAEPHHHGECGRTQCHCRVAIHVVPSP